MRLVNTALAAGLLLAFSTSGAKAITFEISCTGDSPTDLCGETVFGDSTVSATLEVNEGAAGNILQVLVDNTSPIDFAPALTSFGLFVDPDDVGLPDLTVFVRDGDGNFADASLSKFRDVTDRDDGLRANFVGATEKRVKGGIYNPDGEGRIRLTSGSDPIFGPALFVFTFAR